MHVTVLRQVGEELWVYEEPLRMLGVQAGRRMAVIRLSGRDLLVHSPARLTDELRDGLNALGRVAYVLPSSLLHGHLHMENFAAAYPGAELFAAPGLRKRRKDLDFAGDLGDEPDPRWAQEIDQAAFPTRFLNEIVLHHRLSRTLIVGDLVWNVTPRMALSGRLWGGWRNGLRPTPAFRMSIRDRDAAGAAIERMLAWDFDRILIGHGEMVGSGGREALREAYGFLGG
jgi:hypothetical protein